MRRSSVLLIALVFAAVSASGQNDTRDLSLRDAVALALDQSPQLLASAARAEQADARLAQARSTWLP